MCCLLRVQDVHLLEVDGDRREIGCHDISHCVSETLILICVSVCLSVCLSVCGYLVFIHHVVPYRNTMALLLVGERELGAVTFVSLNSDGLE